MKMWLMGLISLGWFANTVVSTGKTSEFTGWIKHSMLSSQFKPTAGAQTKIDPIQEKTKAQKILDPIVLLAQEELSSTLKSQGGEYAIQDTLKWALDKSTHNLEQARALAANANQKSGVVLPSNAVGKVSRPALEEAFKRNPEASSYFLAHALESGEDGGAIDAKRALGFYQKAAESGDIRAQSRLGVAYLKGQLGLEKDYDVAEKWLTEAAIHNDLGAQYYLGRLLLKDRATNVVDALVWVAVAAKRGYEPAQSVVKNYWLKLNPTEQDDLLARVRQWKVNGKAMSVA